jgi:predicted nucleic acid-binding protein
VDAELRRTDDPRKTEGIGKFIKQHQKHMLSPPMPTEEELLSMPPGLKNDRYILSDAIKTETDVIVTNDKTFRSQGKGFGPEVIGSERYLERKGQI